MFNQFIIIVFIALILDLLIGDPNWIPHPVVIIGKFISWGEEQLRSIAKTELAERVTGILLALLTIFFTWLITYGIITISTSINEWLGIIIKILLLTTTLSVKGLADASKGIYQQLLNNDLQQARERLNWIVGRDTEKLSESEVVRATVETVAENTVDGILSPLFYAFIGGAPLAMAYKAVNTLDSMLGYKNQQYQYFGWAAARIDDLANLIPARISGLLFPIAAFLLRKNGLKSFKMVLRDAKKHPSPNGGYPEAAVAGALGVRLGGLNYYHGESSFREYLGDKVRDLESNDIQDMIYLMYITTGLFVVINVLV
ncbi:MULTISPECIES: adenosylcobinamide-phosphate synthase CbiB [unclassified Candidatus Frackibacter]|uniref:adenosylcobinamide-phosphate synthase CbiB n=1 Tax=unclassified Candidatus Frackibacter TaxID=2648818 RepID=UPI000886CB4F|nr:MULTISPECIES: adenosylcobinamide-phosphate synthase CbiB [unclassified Candidatus Frackibacter]SDC33752.1 adenosylcobinamide-phosphate synthase [Candidatus Frackibacter sp. WG11]SEM57417.1 adenosylcobinamide-phosphate synthase [Candidatus Frackibacter sp. WG12]SFL69845.1 adenosylcobinamide-phosphate synthase [Candidatus Frackibacter sp. WG13]